MQPLGQNSAIHHAVGFVGTRSTQQCTKIIFLLGCQRGKLLTKKRMKVKIVGQVRPKKSGKMIKNINLSTIVTDVKQPFPQLLLLGGIGSGKLGLKTGGESGK